MNKDLDKAFPESVIRNQAPAVGQRFLLEVDGVVEEYAHLEDYKRVERFDARMRAELGWIERFTSHAPSVGTYYEQILSDCVEEFLPASIKVSTGFIFDSGRQSVTPQIDLLCYSDNLVAPLYRRGGFAIVQPESVLMACEVKKTLKCDDLTELVGKSIGCNMGTKTSFPRGVQELAVFAYKCSAKTNTVVNCVAEAIKAYLLSFHNRTKDGNDAWAVVQQLCLPSIYMHDREEFVSVGIQRSTTDSTDGRVTLTTLKAVGPYGVEPFLASLSTALGTCSGNHHDECSSYLHNVTDEIVLDVPVWLISRISSSELIRRFPDAKETLRKNKAYAAIFSSFEDPKLHESLDSFSSSAGFSWCISPSASLRR